MKKTVAIVAINLLVAGGISARAAWMILSGCDIGGTCRGSSNLLTWGLAVGPALILLVVLGLSVPKLVAAMAVRREEKSQMKAEKAEAASSDAAESEQGKNRLARLKRPMADADAEELYDPASDEFAEGSTLAEDSEQPDWVANPAETRLFDADASAAPAEAPLRDGSDWSHDQQPRVAASTNQFKFRDMDAIEREWQAAEADLDPAHAAPILNDAPADFRLTPLSFAAPDGDELDMGEFESADDESQAAYASLTDYVEPQAADRLAETAFDLPDPADSAVPESHGWRIAPAESRNQGDLPVPDWAKPEGGQGSRPAASHQPADIWARTTLEGIDEDNALLGVAKAPVPVTPVEVEPVAEAFVPIDLPGIGRAPAQWSWLFADGLPLLRTSKATGFPWIAGGIGEVATAIQSGVDMRGIRSFEAEADAWVRIARSIPYAEMLAIEDAQGFVEWCNALSVDLAASNQQNAFSQAIADAMVALRERAGSDIEISLALPEAFDPVGGGGYGHILTG